MQLYYGFKFFKSLPYLSIKRAVCCRVKLIREQQDLEVQSLHTHRPKRLDNSEGTGKHPRTFCKQKIKFYYNSKMENSEDNKRFRNKTQQNTAIHSGYSSHRSREKLPESKKKPRQVCLKVWGQKEWYKIWLNEVFRHKTWSKVVCNTPEGHNTLQQGGRVRGDDQGASSLVCRDDIVWIQDSTSCLV